MANRLFKASRKLLSEVNYKQSARTALRSPIMTSIPAGIDKPIGPPTVLALTDDDALIDLLMRLGDPHSRVEAIPDCGLYSDLRPMRGCKMVVLDDATIKLTERRWLLGRIREDIPRALLVYVASHHDADTERTARAAGAGYYLSKPVDQRRLSLLLSATSRD